MSKIINKSEAWQGHNRGEVDEVITKDLTLRYPDGGAPEVNIKL